MITAIKHLRVTARAQEVFPIFIQNRPPHHLAAVWTRSGGRTARFWRRWRHTRTLSAHVRLLETRSLHDDHPRKIFLILAVVVKAAATAVEACGPSTRCAQHVGRAAFYGAVSHAHLALEDAFEDEIPRDILCQFVDVNMSTCPRVVPDST